MAYYTGPFINLSDGQYYLLGDNGFVLLSSVTLGPDDVVDFTWDGGGGWSFPNVTGLIASGATVTANTASAVTVGASNNPGHLIAGTVSGVTVYDGSVSATTISGASAIGAGSQISGSTITLAVTASAGGAISAQTISSGPGGYQIDSDGSGSTINAGTISGYVDAENGGSVTGSDISGLMTAGSGGSISGQTLQGSVIAQGGTVSATTITDDPDTGIVELQASSGGTITATNLINDANGTNGYVAAASGGTIDVQNLYSTGNEGMENSVYGGNLTVGNYGINSSPGLHDSLDVGNDGTVAITGAIAIGKNLGDSTDITVDATSKLVLPGDTTIGGAGYGSLSMSGVHTLPKLILGAQSTGDGSFSGSGSNTTLTVPQIVDGEGGFGGIGASAGATVMVNGNLTAGNQKSATGNVTAYGTGSTITVHGLLTLGNAGRSHADAEEGGTINALGGLDIGVIAGSNKGQSGTASPLDLWGSTPATLFTGGSDVTIGDAGAGEIFTEGAATFNGAGSKVVIGNQAGAGGTLIVTGVNADSYPETVIPSSFTAGTLAVGNQGRGWFEVDDSSQATVQGNMSVDGTGSDVTGYVALGGGSLTIDGNLAVGDQPNSNAQVWVQNRIFNGVTYMGSLKIAGSLAISGEGTGSLEILGAGSEVTANSVSVAETSSSGSAALFVNGQGAQFDASDLTIGGLTPAATNDQGRPDGTDGDWTYTGGVGTLGISNGASVSVGGTLTLQGEVDIAADGTETATGGINITAGGNLAIGETGVAAAAGASPNSSGPPPSNLNIRSSQLLIGHGMVDSDVMGYITIGSTSVPTYALNINDDGTFEAHDGILVIHGNVTGDAQATIDDNSTLELGGSVDSTNDQGRSIIRFQDSGTGTLILDNPEGFNGALEGLLDENSVPASGSGLLASNVGTAGGNADLASTVATQAVAVTRFGDTFILRGMSPQTLNGVVAATIGMKFGHLELQILIGTDWYHQEAAPLDYLLAGSSPDLITQDFFSVAETQSGTATALSLTSGNPIDRVVNGPSVPSNISGAGIRVGVISLSATEAAAMRQVILAIAPEAQVFTNVVHVSQINLLQLALHTVSPDNSTAFADVINQDVSASHCQIIVDDIGVPGEASSGSAGEKAIDNAVQKGITYVTAAGNTPGARVGGHNADPNAITVGAINWEATPTTYGGYLPEAMEPFSQIGKIDITAPDGGPTNAGELSSAGMPSPFFGTSAAAPVVAAVAALMMQRNVQLDRANGPGVLKGLLAANALALGLANSGAGLVQANAAVAAAASAIVPFFKWLFAEKGG